MEWEDNEMICDQDDGEQVIEQQQLVPGGPDAANKGEFSHHANQRDTSASSSDDEDEEKLPLVAIHTQYHMSIGGNEMSDSDDSDYDENDERPRMKRGFQRNCPFCQCSLLGLMEPPPEENESAASLPASCPMSPTPTHSSLGEMLDDYLEDYFEDMEIEDDADVEMIEEIHFRFLYRIDITVFFTSRSL